MARKMARDVEAGYLLKRLPFLSQSSMRSESRLIFVMA